MEKGDFPIVLLEAFGELIEVGLDQPTDVLARNERLRRVGVLLHEDLLQDNLDAPGARLVLLNACQTDHRDKALLQA
jgi:hypothetical protein